jgi:hypothetical protein
MSQAGFCDEIITKIDSIASIILHDHPSLQNLTPYGKLQAILDSYEGLRKGLHDMHKLADAGVHPKDDRAYKIIYPESKS